MAESTITPGTAYFERRGDTFHPRAFARGGWGRSIMVSALLAIAAMLIDALLLAFATRQEGPALGLAVAGFARRHPIAALA